MPIFKCTKCGCLDNTACGGSYWWKGKDEAKCAECVTGKWHDIFPKKTPEESNYEPDPKDNNFYAPKGGWK